MLRPNLVAALVGKAAARTEIASNRASVRHSIDFVILASLIAARDLRETELTKKDKRRLNAMLDCCRREPAARSVDRAAESLDRLARAAGLDSLTN